jgi:hypothetical protein
MSLKRNDISVKGWLKQAGFGGHPANFAQLGVQSNAQ